MVNDPSPASYAIALDNLLASYRAIPPSATVRLAKRTSNLFRARQRSTAPGLDVSGLDGVLSIDIDRGTADVGGMCTYEELVAATLPHGLAPLVVPQLKTITVGGATTGGGIESSSFRSGLVFDDIVELDVLTGAGEIVTATPDNDHADLYFGFANSYGSLGYATRLRVRLERIKPFVALRHLRFARLEDLEAAVAPIVATSRHDGIAVDYLDGVVFSRTESYLTLGTLTDEPGPVSDYTGQRIYYRSITTSGNRPVDDSRLPLALGHGLVLVFAGIRCPATRRAPVVAEPAASAAPSIGNWSPWTGGSTSPIDWRGCIVGPRWSEWSRTSRFR